MSVFGEIYTTGKNFTLPAALTAVTNLTSEPVQFVQKYDFCLGNQVFANRAFVTLCVVTIFAFGPITISLFFFELEQFEPGSSFFSENLYPAPLWLTALACTARGLNNSKLSNRI